jgi:hypothetical protein
MKKNNGFKLLALGVGLFILSSCTQSFCSVEDTARVMYAYEGVGTVTDDGYQVSPQLATILTAAESQGIRVPTDEFFESMDEKLLTEARIQANNVNITDAQALEQFGYLKFAGFVGNTETLWANFTKWNNEDKIKFYQWFYKDATAYLSRKKNKFSKTLNTVLTKTDNTF